ncbi:hypothetical protein [Sutcliffiella horikoshii]|nr:hypothetical protein [Sutcliffiella horikoshii]
MSDLYPFILSMWQRKKIDEVKVESYYAKGLITEEEKDQILATPQED